MPMKGTYLESADDVNVALELARCGASTALIRSLTDFGPRWVRGLVRQNGGLAAKPVDLLRWFQKDPQRLIHGRCVVLAHERQPITLSKGRRLLNAYYAYRAVASQPGLLTILQCAEIIRMQEAGSVYTRSCAQCHLPYLVLNHQVECPVCHFVEKLSCRGCGAYMNVSDAALTLGRRYCEQCVGERRTVRHQRRQENLPHLHIVRSVAPPHSVIR